VIDPRDPDTVYFGMTDGSILATEDGGQSFGKIVEGLPGWIAAITVAYPLDRAAPAERQNGAAAAPAPATANGASVEVGKTYEITIAREIENPAIGANGVTRIGDADVRIPNAKVGERYKVKVLALGTNQFTQRTEATVQKVSGPD
jgi:hypothetical protein